jgi:hypothetical protein
VFGLTPVTIYCVFCGARRLWSPAKRRQGGNIAGNIGPTSRTHANAMMKCVSSHTERTDMYSMVLL